MKTAIAMVITLLASVAPAKSQPVDHLQGTLDRSAEAVTAELWAEPRSHPKGDRSPLRPYTDTARPLSSYNLSHPDDAKAFWETQSRWGK